VLLGAVLAAAFLPMGLAALPLAPLLFAAGYHLPVMALKRRCRRRWESLASDLPEVVDLMAVLCYSGESLLSAFRHAASASGNPCSRGEMERVLERVDLGESTVGALRFASDHPCREMRRFARTLIRAEEFGAPVADTLEELALELRNARREKDRARAARVSVLILLPLVFLILPSFLLLTVGGMILGYTL
jgi:tight adherence protein C